MGVHIEARNISQMASKQSENLILRVPNYNTQSSRLIEICNFQYCPLRLVNPDKP